MWLTILLCALGALAFIASVIFALMCYAVGKDSNRGHWDY